MKQKIYVAVCMFACLLLGISAFFSSGDSMTEMRDVNEAPKFINDDKTVNDNFDSEFSDYIAVRMPVRKMFLTAKAFVFEKIFASSSEQDDVIIGKNGWYYFSETVDEFLGTNLLSERSLENIVDTVEQMQEYCNENSIDFVFTVAPNKNTLYPENMPMRFLQCDENNYSRLNEKLKNSNVNYVDFSDLASYSAEPLYYATDSHWNTEGAIVAYNKILESINKEHEDFSSVERITAEKTGDLSRMLYSDGNVAEQEKVPDYTYGFQYASRLKSEEDINIRTKNTNASGSLLMFRDSFTNALLPFMADAFGDAFFTRAVPCDMTLATDMQCDTVIYEIVQRNLENVISFAPVMPAKLQKADFHESESVSDACTIQMRDKNEDLVHVYGTVDSEYLDENSRIYIKLDFENGENLIFRCFNIYEKDLFNDTVCRDNGFSVYIEKNNVKENMNMSIVVRSDDKTFELKSDSEIK